MQMGLYCILIGEMKFSFVKKNENEGNFLLLKTIPSKSFHSMLHLVYRENFLLTCAMKISVANLLQFVALMLKNDNSIDAEKT